jgi:hypothetical protein
VPTPEADPFWQNEPKFIQKDRVTCMKRVSKAETLRRAFAIRGAEELDEACPAHMNGQSRADHDFDIAGRQAQKSKALPGDFPWTSNWTANERW